MRIRATVQGLGKLRRQLDDFSRDIDRRVPRALYRIGEEIMAKSKPLVPVDTGALRASGHVSLPEFHSSGQFSVTLGYGGVAGGMVGGDVGYAVYVHENLEAHHTVGQAKYLEQPLREMEPRLAERLVALIRSGA